MPSTSGKIIHGAVTTGVTETQLTSNAGILAFGVLVKAASGNSGVVYVGEKGVTANSADATDGVPLAASEWISLEIDKINKVYIIGSAAGQKVFFAGV